MGSTVLRRAYARRAGDLGTRGGTRRQCDGCRVPFFFSPPHCRLGRCPLGRHSTNWIPPPRRNRRRLASKDIPMNTRQRARQPRTPGGIMMGMNDRRANEKMSEPIIEAVEPYRVAYSQAEIAAAIRDFVERECDEHDTVQDRAALVGLLTLFGDYLWYERLCEVVG